MRELVVRYTSIFAFLIAFVWWWKKDYEPWVEKVVNKTREWLDKKLGP